MAVRAFDWRDIPALHRYRHQGVFLDSALLLTRGPLMFPGALLSFLAPNVGLLTAVCRSKEKREVLIGQALHATGSHCAHLTFLAPDGLMDSDGVLGLLDYLVARSGYHGALRLLGEIDERAKAFDALRQSGFAVYTRQRIWRIIGEPPEPDGLQHWRQAASRDQHGIHLLYNNLVPALVQQAEPYVARRANGLVYKEGGDVLAYIELKYGHRGIWAQPFVHPDAEQVAEQLFGFLNYLPYRRARPVYVCVRSYQSWLEPAMEEMGAEVSPRQAVMVKQLAIQQRAYKPFALPALEGGHAEVSAPIARSESK